MNGPKVLVIRVLEACNAGCFMCDFAFSTDQFRFTVKDAIRLTQQIQGESYRTVRLTGGEPLMLRGVAEIIRVFSDAGLTTSIITNGWHLPDRAADLAEAGLRQVVVSIDGASAKTHDRFRRLPGLFDRAIRGIRDLKSSGVSVRVNSVIGPHNIQELLDLHQLLATSFVDTWSIIPLKRTDSAWRHLDADSVITITQEFQRAVREQRRPLVLGFGTEWLGRNEQETDRFLKHGVPFTPRETCRLVDLVRYYTPKDGMVYPCNCVPHRVGSVALGDSHSNDGLKVSGLQDIRDWLRDNGPTTCTGCEPINAALGEGAINLNEDELGF